MRMITCVRCGRKRRDYNTVSVRRYGCFDGFELICKDCLEQNYRICDHCGEYHHINDTVHILNTDEDVCGHCAHYHYIQCAHCEELFSSDENFTYTNDGDICERCFSRHYGRCNECGEYIHIDELNYDEDDDADYCNDCWEAKNNVIHNYHDDAVSYDSKFLPDDEDYNALFGFELEVSGNKNKGKGFLNHLGNDVVLMSDSSIKGGGFEIVSMPMTKNYILKHFIPKLSRGLQYLIDNNFNGHNYGGLHIHVSDSMITNRQLAHLKNILYGTPTDKNTWLAITQRQEKEMDEWAKMDNDRKSFDEIYSTPNYEKYGIAYDRYTALHHDDRTDTYEFRIFNSNLRIERFLKNFECVLALLDFTKEHENKAYKYCNTEKFIDYVLNHGLFYPNLYAFFIERGIKEHYGKEYTEEELEVA